jgi:hypothetical protein
VFQLVDEAAVERSMPDDEHILLLFQLRHKYFREKFPRPAVQGGKALRAVLRLIVQRVLE